MSSLPQKLNLTDMQTRWASEIDPILKNATTNPLILPNVTLALGDNVVNHRLGRKLQGWYISRIRGPATIYDTQDINIMPTLTLQLNASAPVSIDLVVW